jgi:hypothetical protein
MWAARARESFLPAVVSIVFRHQPYNMGATDEEKRKFHLGFLDPAFPFLTPAPGQDIIGIGATPHSTRPVDLR